MTASASSRAARPAPSRLLSEPISTTRSGASPCSTPRCRRSRPPRSAARRRPPTPPARRGARAERDAGRELVRGRDDDDLRAPSASTRSPARRPAPARTRSPACSITSRCGCQPGSSTATSSGAALAQPAAEHGEAGAKAAADDHVLRVGGGAARARELRGQRLAQLGDAARVGLAERVERRRAPGGAQRAQPRVAREARAGPARAAGRRRSAGAASGRARAGAGAGPRRRPAPARPGACSGSPRTRAARTPR